MSSPKKKNLSQLTNNNFVGVVPSEIGLLTRLRILYLNSNGLTGSVPPELTRLPALTSM